MKNGNFRIVALLMSIVLLFTLIPVSAEMPSEEWLEQHYTAIDRNGRFIADASGNVKLYSNPVQSPDDIKLLSEDSFPESVYVQFKFTEDDGTEWYVIDSESWDNTALDAYSSYGYVPVSFIGFSLQKTNNPLVFSLGDIVTPSGDELPVYTEKYASGKENYVDVIEYTAQSSCTFVIEDIKSRTDIDGNKVYYYRLTSDNAENWSNNAYCYTTAEYLQLSEENTRTAYISEKNSDGIGVQVSVPDGAFDTDYSVNATAVSSVADSDTVRNAVKAALEKGLTLFDLFSYDVNFTDKNGNELIPKKEIGVLFFFADGFAVNGMTDELRIYHIDESGEDAKAELVATEDRNSGFLGAESKDFSVYSVAAVGVYDITDNDSVPSEEADNGLELEKSAKKNADGTYTLELKAWATGEKITIPGGTQTPTDIVLVLDQSGSMKKNSMTKNVYGEIYSGSLKTGSTYYVKDGNSYTKVTYCSDCKAWTDRCTDFILHFSGNKYTPKASAADTNGVQFYEVTSTESVYYYEALEEAVKNFTDAVYESAKGPDGDITKTADNVDHRIAVVGFASGNYSSYFSKYYYYNNTELFVGDSTYTYNAGDADNADNANSAQRHYSEAFQSLKTKDGYDNIYKSIGKLDYEGGTMTDLGVEMANGIFENDPKKNETGRNRIVIIFTDGAPGWTGDYDSTVANNALTNIKDIKSTYGATVYTVGIFNQADGSVNVTNNGQTASMNSTSNGNKFLHYLSSNYLPNGNTAQTMNRPGTANFPKNKDGLYTGDSYYLSASNADTLNSIFKKISASITTGGSTSTLDENAVLKDIVSDYFVLPENVSTMDIGVYTEAYKGNDDWDEKVKLDNPNITLYTDTKTVEVKGFDYAENWVGNETVGSTSTPRGKRLVITVPIEVRDGFLGGSLVLTNKPESGVYENASAEEAVESFESPRVDIEIKPITIEAPDKNVYLSGSVTDAQLKEDVTVKCGNVDITDPSKLESWQTDYVNISDTEISGPGGALYADSSYTVSSEVSPKYNGTVSGQTKTETGNINVFKPELTFSDSTVYYGDTAPTDYSDNKGAEAWKHGDTAASEVEMLGTKPTLDLTYTPDVGAIADGKIATKQDISVTVTVNIGTNDITGHTTFKHAACSETGCGFDEDEEQFILHVKTCTLTVKKSGGDSDEPYVFYIKKDGNKYTEITVTGNGEVTLYELPVGTYTVEEDTKWAWRYTSEFKPSDTATLSKTYTSATVECKNTKTTDSWLNGFSAVAKNIYGKAKELIKSIA